MHVATHSVVTLCLQGRSGVAKSPSPKPGLPAKSEELGESAGRRCRVPLLLYNTYVCACKRGEA